MSFDTGLGIAAVVVLPLLVAITVFASRYAGLRHDKGIVTAALRAVVQLAAVGAVVGVALEHILGAIAFVLVMFVVATFTSTRRIHSSAAIPRQWVYCATAIGGGAAVVLLLLILPGVVPRNPATILPMGGIIIGGAMTATTLAGRRLLAEYGSRYG
ncbi:MAG TPA: ABC transporter permease, partial [Jatrophihabitantaceae bacterium]|nr:ABC transporter permease [Jatrophihabitantaceae bacterium]